MNNLKKNSMLGYGSGSITFPVLVKIFIRDFKKTECGVFLAFWDLSSPRDAFSTHHFLEQFNVEKPRYARVTSSQIRINGLYLTFSTLNCSETSGILMIRLSAFLSEFSKKSPRWVLLWIKNLYFAYRWSGRAGLLDLSGRGLKISKFRPLKFRNFEIDTRNPYRSIPNFT